MAMYRIVLLYAWYGLPKDKTNIAELTVCKSTSVGFFKE